MRGPDASCGGCLGSSLPSESDSGCTLSRREFRTCPWSTLTGKIRHLVLEGHVRDAERGWEARRVRNVIGSDPPFAKPHTPP